MKYLVALLALIAATANANIITYESTIDITYDYSTNGDGYATVDYISLDITQAGTFTFTAEDYSYDPAFYLLTDDGVLSVDDIIAYNDDENSYDAASYGGTPLITQYLEANQYILAVSKTGFNTVGLISGINVQAYGSQEAGEGTGYADVVISSEDGVIYLTEPEPFSLINNVIYLDEPGSLGLILAGVLSIFIRRRINTKHSDKHNRPEYS